MDLKMETKMLKLLGKNIDECLRHFGVNKNFLGKTLKA